MRAGIFCSVVFLICVAGFVWAAMSDDPGSAFIMLTAAAFSASGAYASFDRVDDVERKRRKD